MLHSENAVAEQLSPTNLQQLEKLYRVINAATANGRSDTIDLEQILMAIFSKRKVMPQKVKLYREEIIEKLQSGALEMDS